MQSVGLSVPSLAANVMLIGMPVVEFKEVSVKVAHTCAVPSPSPTLTVPAGTDTMATNREKFIMVQSTYTTYTHYLQW